MYLVSFNGLQEEQKKTGQNNYRHAEVKFTRHSEETRKRRQSISVAFTTSVHVHDNIFIPLAIFDYFQTKINYELLNSQISQVIEYIQVHNRVFKI